MKNVKKGFTLIEIAIVLVVIGLILGMVMKGRTLIDSAQTRSEVNKINKLQAAYTSFISKHNRRPGTLDNSTQAIYNDLLAEGMVSSADFEIPMVNGYWSFVGCTNPKGGTKWDVKANKDTTNSCLAVTATAPQNNTGDTGADPKKTSLRFICYIENTLDDKNTTTGSGRGTSGSDLLTDYTKCDDAGDTTDQSYLFRIY